MEPSKWQGPPRSMPGASGGQGEGWQELGVGHQVLLCCPHAGTQGSEHAWPLGVKSRLPTALQLPCPGALLLLRLQLSSSSSWCRSPGLGCPMNGWNPLSPGDSASATSSPTVCHPAGGMRQVRSCLCPSSPPPFLYTLMLEEQSCSLTSSPEGVFSLLS